MRRLQIVALSFLAVAIVGTGWVIAGETEDSLCIPMGGITLEALNDMDAQRSEVEFPHSAHFDYNCKACHHTWDGESPVLSCSTSDCHDQIETENDVPSFKSAFHTACIGCHKKIKVDNKEKEKSLMTSQPELQRTGPTGCTGCHPKE